MSDFLKDSTHKELNIYFDDDLVLTNKDIIAESLIINESLFSETTITYGSCEASTIEFETSNTASYKGKEFTISISVDNDIPFQIGKFKVDSDERSTDRRRRNIIAYDKMYDITNEDVASWYNSLTFPLTLKQFRDSLFDYFGVNQEEIVLINDSMIVSETIYPSELSGMVVLNSICELNGAFGHINRQGNFEYIILDDFQEELYPLTVLYPSNNLYPIESSLKRINSTNYTKCKYEDFISNKVTKLQIRQEEGDIGAIVGNGDNTYVVEDNFLCYGMNSTELNNVAENLFQVIKNIEYRPCEIEAKGNLELTIGSPILLKDNINNIEIQTYILQRTLKGIQSLKDTYVADGEEYYTEKVNGTNKEIIQLKGKTNILARTIEETRSEIVDIEKNLSSSIVQNAESIEFEVERATTSEENLSTRITQTAESIELKVSKGDVSSQISIESGDVSISSDRLTIESTNFKLSKSGEVEATGNFITTGFNLYGEPIASKTTAGSFEMFNNDIRIGRLTTGKVDGERCIALSCENIGVFTNGSAVGYIFNPYGNFEGEYSRNVLQGGTRIKNELIPTVIKMANNEATINSSTYGGVPSISTSGGFYAYGNLGCSGTKYRVVKTKNYGNVGMNALETSGAFFADIGSGIISEDGICYVLLEEIFLETIESTHDIYVQITPIGEDNIYLIEKTKEYFVVKGKVGTRFDWMIYAKQRGYDVDRNENVEVPKQEISYDENLFDNDDVPLNICLGYVGEIKVDYEQLAGNYLENYYKEINIYD